ncbi:MAG TPA: response regulator [Gammaproteobacteria bacterium]|nr:response regulator [Gammaproteobacteria bacterium]
MNSLEPTVFLVDDDPAVRDSLSLFLSLKGFRIQPFASAEDFLAVYSTQYPGCLVLDVQLSGMDGLALQARLVEKNIGLPVIVMTAYGDVATARAALKGGAVDFLEKPIDVELLYKAVHEAFDRDRSSRIRESEKIELEARLSFLSEREKQVLTLVVDGKHNREIAAALGISPRTVEVHKARIMEKCRVPRLTDLLRIVLKNSLLQSPR